MCANPCKPIPAAIAPRLGKIRILAVAYIACLDSGDVVCRQKPSGEAHTAAWVETPERINLLLACRELDAHDTGFELLGSAAELLRPRLTPSELATYSQMLEEEIRHGTRGEIDEDALLAKQAPCPPARAAARAPNLSATATFPLSAPPPNLFTDSGMTCRSASARSTCPSPSCVVAWI